MIIQESLTIEGRDFTRTYSDANLYIEDADGHKFIDAIDIVGSSHTYTETDEQIESDTATEADKDAALQTLGVSMEE